MLQRQCDAGQQAAAARGDEDLVDVGRLAGELQANGTVDLSKAYADHIGEWDKVAIDYGYREFPKGSDGADELARILNDAWAADLRYFTNQDTDIHPRADQWTNGANQADELNRLMRIRRAALDRMGETTLRSGAPMATIEEPLVPVFMFHRYVVESTASMIGGQDFVYAMRGDGRTPVRWESARNQKKAIGALVATLKPSELTIPQKVLQAIPPRPPGYGFHRELFPRTTGEAFDPINPGMIAADVTIGFILQSDRAARMVAQHAVDPALPGLGEVIDALTTATFGAATASPYEAEIRRAEERVLVERLAWLAASSPNSQVRAITSLKLQHLAARLRKNGTGSEADLAHHTLLAADIQRFIERPAAQGVTAMPASPAPPGAPIGDLSPSWLARPPH